MTADERLRQRARDDNGDLRKQRIERQNQDESLPRQVQQLQDENERLRHELHVLRMENESMRQQMHELLKERDQFRERWRSAVQAGGRKPRASSAGTESAMSSKLRDALRE